MTRHPPARSLLAVLFAAVLTASGCGDAGVDQRAAEAGISPDREAGDRSATPEGTGEGVGGGGGGEAGEGTDDEVSGFPGGPGGEVDGSGGEGGVDAGGGGNPGGPGDVAVFEEAGVTFETLRTGSAQAVCVEQGLCTLADPVVVTGDPDDVGGVDQCLIQAQSDIRYDPPARDGRFPVGATVTAHVDCTDPDAQEAEQTAEETAEGTQQSDPSEQTGETSEQSQQTGETEQAEETSEGTEPTGSPATGTGGAGDTGAGDGVTDDQPQE